MTRQVISLARPAREKLHRAWALMKLFSLIASLLGASSPAAETKPAGPGAPVQASKDLRAQAREAFERELGKRRISFTIDQESGRYRLELNGTDLLVSTENLERDVARDRDLSRVVRFVDTVVTTTVTAAGPLDPKRLFWCLEPNDYAEKPDYRKPVSDRVDRVLVVLSPDNSRITWVTPRMLEKADLTVDAAGALAFENLAREMEQAKIEFSEIDGVRLGYLNTSLPFKASLVLAPNVKARVEATLGWPLMAVAPDRDFLYLWAAKHDTFINRVGRVTVEQHAKAAYPLSTEVYSISSDGMRVVGEFPTETKARK